MLTLLITVAVVSVLLAIGVKRANDQKAVIAWATKTGGWVSYDFEFDAQDRAIGHYDENNQFVSDATPPGPDWLRDSIGLDFFASINGVYVRGRAVSDLSPLRRLRNLQAVNIFGTNVKDLSPLSSHTQLRIVWIKDTPVEDLQPLTQLTSLERLMLFNTKVSEDEVDMFHTVLPNCRIMCNARKIPDN
jgi:hypothetical protein